MWDYDYAVDIEMNGYPDREMISLCEVGEITLGQIFGNDKKISTNEFIDRIRRLLEKHDCFYYEKQDI